MTQQKRSFYEQGWMLFYGLIMGLIAGVWGNLWASVIYDFYIEGDQSLKMSYALVAVSAIFAVMLVTLGVMTFVFYRKWRRYVKELP